MNEHDRIDDALMALAKASDDVEPSADFTAAVMAEVKPPRRLREDITHSGKWAIGAAALVAAASVALAVWTQNAFDDAVLATVDVVEVVD